MSRRGTRVWSAGSRYREALFASRCLSRLRQADHPNSQRLKLGRVDADRNVPPQRPFASDDCLSGFPVLADGDDAPNFDVVTRGAECHGRSVGEGMKPASVRLRAGAFGASLLHGLAEIVGLIANELLPPGEPPAKAQRQECGEAADA